MPKEKEKQEGSWKNKENRYEGTNMLNLNPFGHHFWFPYSWLLSQTRAPVSQARLAGLNFLCLSVMSWLSNSEVKSPAQQNLKKNILKMRIYIHTLIKTEIKMTHKNSGAFILDKKPLPTYQENDVQWLQKVNFTLKNSVIQPLALFFQFIFCLQKTLNICLSFILFSRSKVWI